MARDQPYIHLYGDPQRSLFPDLKPGYRVDRVEGANRAPLSDRMTYLDAYKHMLEVHEITGLAVVISAEDGTLVDAIGEKPASLRRESNRFARES